MSGSDGVGRSADGAFVARTGHEVDVTHGDVTHGDVTDADAKGGTGRTGDAERARQVRSAWQGLVELRRMTSPDAATDRPCPWERAHLVEAAALALEAAGCRPGRAGAGGYRVSGTPQPEAVAVEAPTAAELRACAAALERAGWQPSEHTDRRKGTRFLLASPRRA